MMSKSKGDITRRKILQQAARLFHERGFTATSMREIATAVGIEASSLYNHITGKDQLLEEICFSVSRAFQESILKLKKEAGSPIEKLKALFRFHLDLALRDHTVITAFNDEWKHLPETSRSIFIAERKAYENYLCLLIIQGQKEGRISAGLEPHTICKTMLSSIRWLYFLKDRQTSQGAPIQFAEWEMIIFKGISN